MRKHLFLTIVFSLLFTGLRAQDSLPVFTGTPEEVFATANGLFESGDFYEAAEGYEQLIDSGYGNAGVHFNLGNCYYRLSENPLAILHYEKALKIDPGYEAAEANLALATANNIDVFEVLPPSIFDTLTRLFFGEISPNVWAVIALVLGLAAALLLLQFYRGGRANSASFSGAMTLLVISVATAFMAWKSDGVQAENQYGIILSPNVYVKTEPTESSTDALILHEGTKVQIQRNYNQWLEVRLVDGRTGWVPAESTLEI
jgi:tetratricopeptide (TPR) repeat protein